MFAVKTLILSVLSLLLIAPLSLVDAAKHELIVFHTNDMHCRIVAGDDSGRTIGLAEFAGAVKAVKRDNPCTLWLDAGDTLHGMPRITISKGENMVPLFQTAGIDGFTPGNHDFNYGAAQLKKIVGELSCPVFSANIVLKEHPDEYFLPRYHIYELPGGIKAAVFGLATPETAYLTAPRNVNTLEFLDPVQQAKKMVRELRSQCDVLIALTHIGVDPSAKVITTRLAQEVPGIDLIVDGHSHTTLPHGIAVGDTLVVQTGCYGHALGKVTLEIDDGKIANKRAELLSADDIKAISPQPDRETAAALATIEKKNKKYLDAVVAQNKQFLPNKREITRTSETALGDVTADALRYVSGADIAIVNSGSLRTELPQGQVKRSDILSIFPFGNIVERVEVSGKTVREVLEHSVSRYPGAAGGFAQVSGLSFTFDAARPSGQRVLEVQVGNKPLDDNLTYTLAAPDFVLTGGDGYDMLKGFPITGVFGAVDEVITEYLRRNPNYTVDMNRIKILNAVKAEIR